MQLTATSWNSCSFALGASAVHQVFVEVALYYLIQRLAILRNTILVRKLFFCTLPYLNMHDVQFCTIFCYCFRQAHCFVTVVLDMRDHSKCRCVSFIHNHSILTLNASCFNVMRYK